MDSGTSESEIIEEYVIEYYETTDGQGKSPKSNGDNNPKESNAEKSATSEMEKRPQIYTCYVKEEPRTIEEDVPSTSHDEIPASRSTHESIVDEPISSNSMSPMPVMPETYIPETIVPDFISSETNITLEPRKRGRPKKKPISVLTPMEISNNHDARSVGETLESMSEHLYAGFLGRTRRTTRQNLEEADGKGSSEESEPEDDDDYSTRRGRPFGSVKNRGRGRGRSRARGTGSGRGRGRRSKSKKEVNDSLIAVDIEEPELEEETHQFSGAEPSANFSPKVCSNVRCAKCQEEFPKREWSRHNLLRHNDTAWLEGQPPVDYDADEKLLKKILMIAIKKRKGQLSCEQCGTIKRSVVGFLSHTRFCGKTESERQDLMVQCPRCMSSVKPTSMYTHERNCQREKVPPSLGTFYESEENPELNTSQGKSKRRAAEKAVSKISEFTTAVRANAEEVTPHTVKYFIQKPALERKVRGTLRNAFYNDLDLSGKADCRQPGCQFSGTTLESICEHYAKCNFEVQENYICRICNFHSLIHKEIMDHVLEKHSKADASDNYAEPDPDHHMKSEDSSEGSDPEPENPENIRRRIASKLRFIPEASEDRLRAYKAEFLDMEPLQNAKKNVPYTAAYRWTLNFELENYQLELFKDLLPNDFIPLNKEEGETFLPELRRSMAMQKNISDTSEFGNSETRTEWSYWQKFEGRLEEGVPTFFVGGPVWALAWLPIPIPMYSHQPIQYLAVSTHPTMESEYSVGQAYSGKNVLQIWNLGSLHQQTSVLFVPELSYAVAHNGGTVWCMEWCPSGCYQDQRIVKFEKEPNKAKRMGLLAAACSDGFVHIYSLPFPEELTISPKEKNQLPVYKANPVQLLVVNIALTEREKQTWQCTKLSWTKENGHNILAAGFSNGYIALWNLTTQSSLLKKKQGSTTLLNSFRHFYAHHHSVSMISMIPYGEKRFLASAGIDRCYKVWDLEQPNCVECVTTRGLAVDGAWMNNWPCAVLSYDDALGLSHTNSQLIPLREHSYKYFPILATNSATYAISVSDHANAIAQGNQAGEIVTIFPHQVLYKDIENYLNKKRWLCSYVQVTDFKSSENVEDDSSKIEKKEYRYKPATYSECSERFGISFSDDFKTFRTCKAKQLKEKVMPTDQLETVSVEQYPFASVNRISWNPNAWSYLWFAAGYQNGFIRILNFNSTVNTDLLKKCLPRFSNQMRDKHKKLNENNRPEGNNENGEGSEEVLR
ncbi:uncharacterized protein LOC117181408 isoform X2 [Belonocnema kinseyi]|nr:uncharacterized protein LOC117181408 isoform X2 [Belonocnema kinseyi]